MTEIKPFKAKYMMEVLANGILECGVTTVGNDALRKLAQQREDGGKCLAGFTNGRLIGVGGIDMYWPGVGEVWMMLCDKGKEHPMESIRGIREILNTVINDNYLWRVQTTCRADFPEAIRIVKILGFKYDCKLDLYGPDRSDYFLYSMVI